MATYVQQSLPLIKEKTQRRAPPKSKRELEVRAAALRGHRVAQLASGLGLPLPTDPRRSKGFVGQLVERALGADPKAGAGPDFPQWGVELKTIPIDAKGRPAESTFVCSVRMDTVDRERWDDSRLRKKLACVLWVPVQGAKLATLGERLFGCAQMWQPNQAMRTLLRNDWEDLMGMLGCGRQVDAHHGVVLQLRPKAADSKQRTVAPGVDGSGLAPPLGFYLRPSFTKSIIQTGQNIC